MELTFQNFKQLIPAQILERGQNYFRGGNISDLEIEDDGIWSAQVMGTEDYDVHIEQMPDGILDCTCTCPYDGGLHCKHVAAVLYAIEESFPEAVRPHKRKTSKANRQSKEDKLRESLNKASHEKLVATIMDIAGQDKQLRNQLMLRFGTAPEDKTTYSKMVKDALRAHMEHGFLDYQGTRHAGRDVNELLDRADQLLEEDQWESAVSFYQAVMEIVVESIGQADDSDGALSSCMARAIEGLSNAAEIANPVQQAALFAYSLEEAQRSRYAGWDWRWELYELVADLVEIPQEREQLFAALDKYHVKPEATQSFSRHEGFYLRDDFMSRFDVEQAAMLKLMVIEQDDGPQAAEKFIAENLDLDRFRGEMIKRQMNRGRLAEAKQLANDGIKRNANQGLPGLVSQYRQLLLEIAKREKDTNTIVTLARELLLEGRETQYYDLLKSTFTEAQWPTFVRALIKDAKAQRFLGGLVNWIYAREGMWREILNQAKPDWNTEVEQYRKELEKQFPNEVADIYESTIYKMLEQANGRDAYQLACEYLRRLGKLGKSARTKAMVSELSQRYPRRRALLEELANV